MRIGSKYIARMVDNWYWFRILVKFYSTFSLLIFELTTLQVCSVFKSDLKMQDAVLVAISKDNYVQVTALDYFQALPIKLSNNQVWFKLNWILLELMDTNEY